MHYVGCRGRFQTQPVILLRLGSTPDVTAVSAFTVQGPRDAADADSDRAVKTLLTQQHAAVELIRSNSWSKQTVSTCGCHIPAFPVSQRGADVTELEPVKSSENENLISDLLWTPFPVSRFSGFSLKLHQTYSPLPSSWIRTEGRNAGSPGCGEEEARDHRSLWPVWVLIPFT